VAIRRHAVVVVADTFWNARTALGRCHDWDVGKLGEVQTETIKAMLKEALAPARPSSATRSATQAAIDGAAKKWRRLQLPYQHHVTMEPMNATARVSADKCEVWCGTRRTAAALRGGEASACGRPVQVSR